jgi:type IV pilus modification protein PilV
MGGFSMVEVMVTVIVVVFGLLGLVKMQGLAISATANSSRRGLAAIEADSLANAMQVNHAYWAQGLVSTISRLRSIVRRAITHRARAPRLRRTTCNNGRHR